MSRSVSATAALDRENLVPGRLAPLTRYRVALLAFLASIVLLAALIELHINPLNARDVARSGSVMKQGVLPEAAISPPASRQKLGELHEASARLAKDVLRQVAEFERLEREAADREMAVREVRKSYASARSARELAEFAIVEYEQGNARREEANAAGEVFEARQDHERALHEVDVQKERLAHIKESSTDAIARLAASMLIKDRLRVAVLRENDAALVLDQAESKRQLLLEKTKPARVKDLRAAADELKSVEHSWQARWDLERSKLEQVRQAALRQAPTDAEKHVLALLNRGISIEERIQVGLAMLMKNGEAESKLVAEIDDLTSQLESIVNEARVDATAADDARLKPRIKAAANRYRAATKTTR
jgi:hypothetical protein